MIGARIAALASLTFFPFPILPHAASAAHEPTPTPAIAATEQTVIECGTSLLDLLHMHVVGNNGGSDGTTAWLGALRDVNLKIYLQVSDAYKCDTCSQGTCRMQIETFTCTSTATYSYYPGGWVGCTVVWDGDVLVWCKACDE